MKKIYFILFILFTTSLFAQHTSTGVGRWRLGLNIGGTWQTANINSNLLDLGYGATLEYAIHENHSSFFGFSLRGRFLRGQTRGFNKLKEYGVIDNNNINGTVDSNYNYSNLPIHLNNRTKYNEFSLETMLKWNKLYQNHGIVFYLYLGAGFTHYKVETNQQNEFGVIYDYSTITENTSNTVDDIKFMLDDSYETDLEHPDYNSLVFTPSIGIGFGFRVTRGFDIVWEHKTSLPQTDLFEGQSRDLDDPSFVKDIYHYSSLGFVFSIIGHNDPTAYEPPVEPSEPVVPVTPVTNTSKKPTITLTKPITNTFSTPNCKVQIEAKIEHVKSQNDIQFFHNGNKVPGYQYFFTPNTFKSTIQLKEGNNTFKIIAKNENYSTSKSFSLNCNNVNTIEICHKDSKGNKSNILIKESEWNAHAAHGDTKGKCAEKQLTICHNIPGQGGKTQTITINESEWNIHQSHGDYLGACSEKKMITICHQNQEITIDEKDWAIYANQGAIKGNCPPPQVKMITICHIPKTGNKRITMNIPENEWIVHQAHGDVMGTCPTIEPTIEICHKNSNGSKSNLTIPSFRWNEHFSHGDSKGKCPEKSFIICHTDPVTKQKQNISITESLWAIHAAHGDTKDECPVVEKQITICHNIPGQPGKTQTITIPESKWLLHKSHGDKQGKCITKQEDKIITICHKSGNTSSTMQIKESQWANHAAHGDTKGACPVIEKQITICHNIPGQPGKTQTITIPESLWLLHKSHGDKLGKCVTKQEDKIITICHKSGNTSSTIKIKESQWASHAAHGDTKGVCKEKPKMITICHNAVDSPILSPTGTIIPKKTMLIPLSEWSKHAAHGDTKGACKDNGNNNGGGGLGNGNNNNSGGGNGSSSKKIKICHYPPGNTSNPQTIEIPESAWKAHEKHGDTKGECQTKKVISNPTIPKKNKGGKSLNKGGG